MDIIGVFDMSRKEYNKRYFVEDIEAWRKAIGIKNTDGLIGLTQEEFNKEVNRRF